MSQFHLCFFGLPLSQVEIRPYLQQFLSMSSARMTYICVFKCLGLGTSFFKDRFIFSKKKDLVKSLIWLIDITNEIDFGDSFFIKKMFLIANKSC